MSQLHVTQIAGVLHRHFDGLIDIADASPNAADREKCFLSRALSAFAVAQLAGVPPADAAGFVTDGSGDNGVDAIYFDRTSKTLYIVQAKWFGDGHGSFDRADVLKLTTGFRDLVNLAFDRFNSKLRKHESAVKEAFYDANARYVIVPIYTGQEDFAVEPQRDLDDCLLEFNDSKDPDAEELLTARVLKQSDVYSLITRGVQGAPIDLDVLLYEWGEVQEPYAVYGQVAASDIAAWWNSNYPQIVAPNIRMFLGNETEVNIAIQNTLINEPEHFWHFNNGITVLCQSIKRKMIGGNTRSTGHFNVSGVSIVNGAQTAGSVSAAFAKRPDKVSLARVPVRFISIGEDSSDALSVTITRATNTQNRINRQDFVALDQEQQRIRDELRIDGVSYIYKSGDGSSRDASTFTIEEATVALACAYKDLSYSTQAKREIGKLWEDTSKAPYKALFNSGTSSSRIWIYVQVLRTIDAALSKAQAGLDGRDAGFAIHGNRFIAHEVFRRLPRVVLDADRLPQDIDRTVTQLVFNLLNNTVDSANKRYPQAYLAQLFKNQQKLAEISQDLIHLVPIN